MEAALALVAIGLAVFGLYQAYRIRDLESQVGRLEGDIYALISQPKFWERRADS